MAAIPDAWSSTAGLSSKAATAMASILTADFEGSSIGNQHTDVVSTEAFGFEFPAEVVVQRLHTDHRPVAQQGHIVLHAVTLGDQPQQADFASANSQAIDRLRSWGGYAQD